MANGQVFGKCLRRKEEGNGAESYRQEKAAARKQRLLRWLGLPRKLEFVGEVRSDLLDVSEVTAVVSEEVGGLDEAGEVGSKFLHQNGINFVAVGGGEVFAREVVQVAFEGEPTGEASFDILDIAVEDAVEPVGFVESDLLKDEGIGKTKRSVCCLEGSFEVVFHPIDACTECADVCFEGVFSADQKGVVVFAISASDVVCEIAGAVLISCFQIAVSYTHLTLPTIYSV